ncbi:MAG TPA: hypothetical protein VI159_05640 [Gemmatimonadales bacterium]
MSPSRSPIAEMAAESNSVPAGGLVVVVWWLPVFGFFGVFVVSACDIWVVSRPGFAAT